MSFDLLSMTVMYSFLSFFSCFSLFVTCALRRNSGRCDSPHGHAREEPAASTGRWACGGSSAYSRSDSHAGEETTSAALRSLVSMRLLAWSRSVKGAEKHEIAVGCGRGGVGRAADTHAGEESALGGWSRRRGCSAATQAKREEIVFQCARCRWRLLCDKMEGEEGHGVTRPRKETE